MRPLLRSVLLVLSVPALLIVVAWAVGDLSEPMAVDGEGQILRPVRMDRAVEVLLVVVSCVVLVVAAVIIARAASAGGPASRAVVAVLPMLALAAGVGYRVMSASVVGANIGAGWATMILVPGIPLALVASVRLALAPDPPQSGKGAPPAAR